MGKPKNKTDEIAGEVTWSSRQPVLRGRDRRSGLERRQLNGRSITVPDMRSGIDRRSGKDRRQKDRLTITGRAIDI